MKKVWSQGLLVMLITLLINGFVPNTSNAQGSVSLQVFYDELQPYGTWTQHARYGYVWMPNVDRGFTPYSTNGYWINTEYGNTWVSDYSWGWAPFHYGRWFYDDFSGWIWVPDTEWAPAWVAWRSGGGYYGWAPLMPGFGVSMSYNYYNTIPHRYWNFVPHRYITYRTVHHHCVPRMQVVNIYNHTTIITHNYTDNHRRTYFTGPSRSDMERTGRTRVDVYRIQESSRPGRTDIDRGTASFYRPEINNSREARNQAEPSRYTRENGSGRMEVVESRARGRQQDFVRERNDDRNVESQPNAVREDYRANNATPEIESNSNRPRNLENQRNAVREDFRTNNATPGRESNSNRPQNRDEWQKEFSQPNRGEETKSESRSRNFSNTEPNRENIRREQFGFDDQRQQPARGRMQTDQQPRKEPAQQSQRTQFDRQTERNPSGRESQNFNQRSSTQNLSRENMPARNGEVQRSTGGSRSNQPATRSSGLSHDNRSRHRD